MKDRFLRWFFEPLEFEHTRQDGTGWGFEYNRAALAVIGAVGALGLFWLLLVLGRAL